MGKKEVDHYPYSSGLHIEFISYISRLLTMLVFCTKLSYKP